MGDDQTGSRADAPQREEWKVLVLDAVTDEPRNLIVAVSETRVVIVSPPGGGYVVPPRSIPIYVDALNTARNVAARRQAGYRSEFGGS